MNENKNTYLDPLHRQRNPRFDKRKTLAMKLSSNPAMWGNLKSINALMTKDSVRHKKSHVTEKFSMKDVKAAISICTGPKSIRQVRQGVQIVLFSIMAYPNWVINWFFNDLFKGSPPYFSNIETKMLNPLVKVSNIRQTIPAVTLEYWFENFIEMLPFLSYSKPKMRNRFGKHWQNPELSCISLIYYVKISKHFPRHKHVLPCHDHLLFGVISSPKSYVPTNHDLLDLVALKPETISLKR